MTYQLNTAEYSYLKDVIQAVARGEQPDMLIKPLVDFALGDDRVARWRQEFRDGDRLCAAATAYFLRHSTPVPPNYAFIEKFTEHSIQDIEVGLNQLLSLEEAIFEERYKPLPPTLEEEKARVAWILKEQFASPEWKDLTSFRRNMATDRLEARNIIMVRDLMSGKYPSVAAAAKANDLSGSRLRDILFRTFRQWSHPRVFGRFFKIGPADILPGSRPQLYYLQITQFDQRDEDGQLKQVFHGQLRLPEIYEHLKAFFASLGLTMHVPVRSTEDTMSEVQKEWLAHPDRRGRRLVVQCGYQGKTLLEITDQLKIPSPHVRKELVKGLEELALWAKPLRLPYVRRVINPYGEETGWELINTHGEVTEARRNVSSILQCLTQFVRYLGLDPKTYYHRKYSLVFPG